MKNVLHKLRQQPDHKKNKIVIVCALVTTILIGIVYLVLITINTSSTEPQESSTTETLNGLGEVFTNSFDEFNEARSELQEQRAQLKEIQLEAERQAEREALENEKNFFDDEQDIQNEPIELADQEI